jgi:hypothetical protein
MKFAVYARRMGKWPIHTFLNLNPQRNGQLRKSRCIYEEVDLGELKRKKKKKKIDWILRLRTGNNDQIFLNVIKFRVPQKP